MKVDHYIPRIRGRVAALAVAVALALPMAPGAAYANPVDVAGTLESAIQSIAEPAQEADGGIDLMAATTAPKYDYQVYYIDGLGDTWYNNSKCMRYLYIRTDNPDASFSLQCAGATTTYYDPLKSGEFDDIDDQGVVNHCLRVPGGYVAGFAFKPNSTGAKTLSLYEKSGSRKVLAATFTANFVDYDQALNKWVDDAFAKYGKSIKNPVEKLSAVCDGLRAEFHYPLNDGEYLIHLVTRPDEPFFVTKTWDSYVSPTTITYIANRMGVFEDVHNCFFDYEKGTEAYYAWHYYCRVTYQGEDYYLEACPSSSTGEMSWSSIKKLNFNNTSSSTFDEPRGFKQVEAQPEQKEEHKVSIKSDHGSVSVTGGYSVTEGEKVNFTIKSDSGYEIASVEVVRTSGWTVKVSGSGETRSFTMPDEDVTITVRYKEVSQLYSYSVNFENSPEGYAETGSAAAGDRVDFTVKAFDGYDVSSVAAVTSSGKSVTVYGSGEVRWFTMPNDSVEVVVVYQKDTRLHSYVIESENLQSGWGSAGVSYAGEKVHFDIKAYDGYVVSSVTAITDSGKSVAVNGTGNTRWFTMPNEGVRVTVTYVNDDDNLQYYSVGSSGLPFVWAGVGMAPSGAKVSVILHPYDGYTVTSVSAVTDSGKSVEIYGSGDTRWFTMPDEGASVTVHYEKAVNKRYIDVVQPTEGGTVSISGSPATVGSVVKVYPKPDDGWKVGSVTYTDASGKAIDIPQTANTTWAFDMPDADVTVKVTFVKDAAYRVKANKPAHATVYLQDRGYAPGEEVYYMIDPDEGYGVASIKAVDGNGKAVKLTGPVSYPDGLRYTFTMPESDVTITAAVEEDKEVQAIDVVVHDCSVLAPQEAKPGVEVNLHVEPNDGYALEKSAVVVTGKDGKRVAVTERGAGEYWFTMPDGPVTVTATATEAGDTEEPEKVFSDVPSDAWYAEPVAWAVENGIFHGYEGSDNFGPDDSITRAQMATVLYNVAKNPEVDTTIMDRFEDCVAGSWYGEAVSWAVQEGIFSGYSDSGNFGPDDPITREQIAVVLWRQAGEPAAAGDLASFPDGWKTSTWALEAMTWAVDEGIFTGNSVTGELMPTGNLTRAEAATVMMRLLS